MSGGTHMCFTDNTFHLVFKRLVHFRRQWCGWLGLFDGLDNLGVMFTDKDMIGKTFTPEQARVAI